jgi:hypothetical protein
MQIPSHFDETRHSAKGLCRVSPICDNASLTSMRQSLTNLRHAGGETGVSRKRIPQRDRPDLGRSSEARACGEKGGQGRTARRVLLWYGRGFLAELPGFAVMLLGWSRRGRLR